MNPIPPLAVRVNKSETQNSHNGKNVLKQSNEWSTTVRKNPVINGKKRYKRSKTAINDQKRPKKANNSRKGPKTL